jgi:hypothetical protein
VRPGSKVGEVHVHGGSPEHVEGPALLVGRRAGGASVAQRSPWVSTSGRVSAPMNAAGTSTGTQASGLRTHPVSYEARWASLDRRRKQLRTSHWMGLAWTVWALATFVSLGCLRHSADWVVPVLLGTLLAPYLVVTVHGLVGLSRVMEFRCPRCDERFHMAGDAMVPFSTLTRRKCTACGLPKGVLSDPDAPDPQGDGRP